VLALLPLLGPHDDVHRVTVAMSAQAEVTKVDGRRIEFNVSARNDSEEIGNGTHERMVVDLARLDQRLKAKASR
jgi:fluoroacetyl-CoA thioesterase